ncbi:hypothetical protein PS918_03373 [Pseudomonas fluorescens]|uniref:CHASE2 domain-containing protein n=1 Tax=Pseudomonas fluorescens TaxID=294 RepID=A0A5E7T060_PSEFL|nr:CHASE2 domain-containing protein [Pseudomonas fluorescens]VVP92452.1 hypothetical protein PS918_03373 [Pseudomonas fluorescens]
MTGHDKSEHWIARFISAGTHHLPAALMVTAIVSICHHDLHMLDAIDGYAFLAIGNLTANSVARETGSDPKVAVVLIDQKSNEDYYRERSPLNRCQLKNDLQAIYDLPGRPKLVVVDLDLSPVLLDSPLTPLNAPANAEAKLCDEQLLTLLTKHREGIETVLMAPFKMLDAGARQNIKNWRTALEGFVSFADDPTIRVSYGLVNDLECEKSSLAAAAYDKYPDKPLTNCLKEKQKKLTVNPGHYFSGLRAVSLSQLPTRLVGSQCSAKTPYEALYLPVVFLGTSFGDSDTFLTPLGTMYGVEVHAAAFMSLVQPTTQNEVLAFVLDLGLGLLMGGLIAWAWRRYFNLRFSSRAFDRQRAPWLILILAIGFVVLVAVLTYLSFLLLRYRNIWLSPIPIALGMLIESFFNSAVSAAVGEGYEQRQALIKRLRAAHKKGTENFSSQVAVELEQRPHHAHSLQERALRFIYLDCKRLRRSGQYGAVILLCFRRTAFFLLLLAAFREQLLHILEKIL